MTEAHLPAEFADLEPFADWALAHRGRALRQAPGAAPMDELQAFYDAAFPRLDDAMAYLDQFELAALPDDADTAALAVLLARQRVVPGRGVAPAPGARQRRRGDGRGRRAGRLTEDPQSSDASA